MKKCRCPDRTDLASDATAGQSAYNAGGESSWKMRPTVSWRGSRPRCCASTGIGWNVRSGRASGGRTMPRNCRRRSRPWALVLREQRGKNSTDSAFFSLPRHLPVFAEGYVPWWCSRPRCFSYNAAVTTPRRQSAAAAMRQDRPRCFGGRASVEALVLRSLPLAGAARQIRRRGWFQLTEEIRWTVPPVPLGHAGVVLLPHGRQQLFQHQRITAQSLNLLDDQWRPEPFSYGDG